MEEQEFTEATNYCQCRHSLIHFYNLAYSLSSEMSITIRIKCLLLVFFSDHFNICIVLEQDLKCKNIDYSLCIIHFV